MGVTDKPYIEFEATPAAALTEMYERMGDQIALQYGGSHLNHTGRLKWGWARCVNYFCMLNPQRPLCAL